MPTAMRPIAADGDAHHAQGGLVDVFAARQPHATLTTLRALGRYQQMPTHGWLQCAAGLPTLKLPKLSGSTTLMLLIYTMCLISIGMPVLSKRSTDCRRPLFFTPIH